MNAIHKILVPTDFSPAAQNGLHYAVQLAPLLGASIILYHSYSPIESGFFPEAMRDEENNEEEQKLRDRLNTIRDEIIRSGSQVPVSIYLEKGTDIKRITAYCTTNCVDLVIMGTTGATGAKEVLIGSFTSHVISEAACPVLAVPPTFEFRVPKKIFYASDYKSTDFKGIHYTARLKDQLHAELQMVHAVFNMTFAAQEDKLLKSYQAKLAKLLHLDVAELPYHLVRGEDTSDTLLHYAVKERADMLVIAQSKQTNLLDWMFHRSLTKEVVHQATVPILALPVDFLETLPAPEHAPDSTQSISNS
ncbi:universal stress protein [Telluribacter sp. SYSU D00476]|uniref:universal stress protein n=1 Tax=Telluribacter sp. SYSU D00476 TaxID=2811430 RepID=UPI001FF5CCD9|nr:universal stress protein [Telluribacter sp. SYSU D00476]